MVKFAFRHQREKTALMGLLKRAPLALKPTFISIAQSIDTQRQVGGPDVLNTENPAVEDSLGHLRDMLHEYLREVHLDTNQSAIAFVEEVVNGMREPVSQTIQSTESTWDRLESAPWVKKEDNPTGVPVPGPEETLEPEMAQTFSDRMPPIPKPEVLTKNEKISPTSPAPLWRKKPQMSTGASLKDETFDVIVASILDLADITDEAGMLSASDRLAAVLPAMRTIKVAQYEGFQNYWIANGRAFEMAYKQKRMKGKDKPEDFRSAHEVWFEILEEYQKSLLTNQADFISKYAGKDYTHTDRAASSILMNKISSRIQKGSSPGVALYESIDELANGQHFRTVGASVFDALDQIEAESTENGLVVISDKAKALKKTAAGWFGKLLRNLGFNYGNPTTSIPKVLTDGVKRKIINDLSSLYYRAQSTPTPASEIYNSIGQYYDLITEFMDRARYVKRKGIPTLQDPASVAGPDGSIDPNKMSGFVNSLQSAFAFIHPEVAERIDKDIYSNSEGLEGPAAGYLPQDKNEAPGTDPLALSPGASTPPETSPEDQAVGALPADSPTAAPDIAAQFKQTFPTMPTDKQFDLLTQMFAEYSKWYKTPDAVKLMTQKGVSPTGKAFTAPASGGAPAAAAPATPAPAAVTP